MKKRGAKRRISGGHGGLQLLARHQAHQRRIESLSRLPSDDDQQRLILPARTSAVHLFEGRAEIADLHNVVAYINVGSVLADDIGEYEARDAVQAALHHLITVKGQPGPTYSLNDEQRESIAAAVDLVDELICCSTILELHKAHQRVLSALDGAGDLGVREVAA